MSTKIETSKKIINKTQNEVYTFLTDLTNFKELMPSDVTKFEATSSVAQLGINGLGEFSIEIDTTEPSSFIKLLPKGKLPFKFHIEWHILAFSPDQSEAQAIIHADLNMFMKMMAIPKLKSFAEEQVSALKSHLESK